MPRRTDPFQKIIGNLHRQLDRTARVLEPAMVRDQLTGIEREVDVLVVGTSHGLPAVMAVECRNRGRPASVEWIDQIYGKYRDLAHDGQKVNRVIAVSASGFYPKALELAQKRGIETMTFREASQADWAQVFGESITALRVLLYQWNLLNAKITPAQPAGAFGDAAYGEVEIIGPTGQSEGTVFGVWESITTRDDFRRSADEYMPGGGATRIETTYRWPPNSVVRVMPTGATFPLEAITFVGVVHKEVTAATDAMQVLAQDSTGDVRAVVAHFATLGGGLEMRIVRTAHGDVDISGDFSGDIAKSLRITSVVRDDG